MDSEGAAEDHAVSAGTIIFAKAGVKHRFDTITEGLVVLVFFAPAESTERAHDVNLPLLEKVL
jgi:quercetin dioxygenase-like cupin family protein